MAWSSSPTTKERMQLRLSSRINASCEGFTSWYSSTIRCLRRETARRVFGSFRCKASTTRRIIAEKSRKWSRLDAGTEVLQADPSSQSFWAATVRLSTSSSLIRHQAFATSRMVRNT